MSDLVLDQELPTRTLVAKNYATDSANRMHSDDGAAPYGFRGGLVPGIGIYAYMTIPVAEALGAEWVKHGTFRGKFIKPVYHGETITIQSRVVDIDPVRISVSVINAGGTLCGVGEASLPEKSPYPDISRFPFKTLSETKLPPDIALLTEGTPFGSLEFSIDPQNLEGEHGSFLDEMLDESPLYRGPDALMHPAYIPHKANTILAENVDLGPWIHTASDVIYFEQPNPGETLFMQGRVAHSYSKRGHDIVVLDLVLLGDHERLIAHLTHSAIVKPHKVEA